MQLVFEKKLFVQQRSFRRDGTGLSSRNGDRRRGFMDAIAWYRTEGMDVEQAQSGSRYLQRSADGRIDRQQVSTFYQKVSEKGNGSRYFRLSNILPQKRR